MWEASKRDSYFAKNEHNPKIIFSVEFLLHREISNCGSGTLSTQISTVDMTDLDHKVTHMLRQEGARQGAVHERRVYPPAS